MCIRDRSATVRGTSSSPLRSIRTPPAMRLILLRSPLHRTIAALSLVIGSTRGFPQQVEGTPPVPSFDKTEVMVPMRDGVKLHTNVFVPRGFAANLPIIFVRTPYGLCLIHIS